MISICFSWNMPMATWHPNVLCASLSSRRRILSTNPLCFGLIWTSPGTSELVAWINRVPDNLKTKLKIITYKVPAYVLSRIRAGHAFVCLVPNVVRQSYHLWCCFPKPQSLCDRQKNLRLFTDTVPVGSTKVIPVLVFAITSLILLPVFVHLGPAQLRPWPDP